MERISLTDYRILLASLLEIKEAHNELTARNQLNSAERLEWAIFDRAERLTTGRYANGDSPTTPPHTN